MASCSISLGDLAKCLQKLWHLLFDVLSKIQALAPSFHEGDQPSMAETVTANPLPELPQDMLVEIFSLLEIPDLVRAGSVCNSWRSAYNETRSLGIYKLSQTPCLLYTSESAGDSAVCLYSLVEKRQYMFTLPDPPVRSRFLIGSSLGWLVTVDASSEMHLVNPITGQQIALPSVATIEHIEPIFNESGAIHKYELSWYSGSKVYRTEPSVFTLGELRDYMYYKAFVFFDTSAKSYLVVLIHCPLSQLSFARVGDDEWTWIPPRTFYDDCIYVDGHLYASTEGEVHVFDLSGPVVTMKTIIGKVPLDSVYNKMYIVQAPWGGLLNVWRTYEDNDDLDDPDARNTGEIKIFSIDATEKKRVEIKNLDGHALFLGLNQSLCLSTKEYRSLKENYTYFADDNDLWLFGFRENRRDIGLFDLKTNSREELVAPQLWSNFPAPVWITPSFAKILPV
uniref:F-box domain-containing protein n=1 Tax=Oryza brachyantha TaxID=4533 RepID=J3L8N0_ORYBR